MHEEIATVSKQAFSTDYGFQQAYAEVRPLPVAATVFFFLTQFWRPSFVDIHASARRTYSIHKAVSLRRFCLPVAIFA